METEKDRILAIGERVQAQIDLDIDNRNVYCDDFCYVNTSNLSNDDRLKFRIDRGAGTLTLGNFNACDGEEVAVPLASISGNYYANVRKIEYVLGNPKRTFLKGLHYVDKSEGSSVYDVQLPDWAYYETWY